MNGRLSFLETSIYPIKAKDLKQEFELNKFYDKYDVDKQATLIINNLRVSKWINSIDPAVTDNTSKAAVYYPNLYYRYIFWNLEEQYVLSNYMSINISFPVYVYMYFNFFTSIIISSGVIVLYFLLCTFFMSPSCRKFGVISSFMSVILLCSLYTFLYYFDFIMWFNQCYQMFLVGLFVILFNLLIRMFKNLLHSSYKKNEDSSII